MKRKGERKNLEKGKRKGGRDRKNLEKGKGGRENLEKKRELGSLDMPYNIR